MAEVECSDEREELKGHESMFDVELQEAVMRMYKEGEDIEIITRKLEEGQEGSELAKKMFENVNKMRKLREQMTDDQLMIELFGFKPMGPCKIEITPVSLSIAIYNPVDWVRMNERKGIFGVIKWSFFQAGQSGERELGVGSDRVMVNVDIHKAWALKTKAHEVRHSLTRMTGAGEDKNSQLIIDLDVTKEEMIDQVVDFIINNFALSRLKNELLSYIAGGTNKTTVMYYTFRPSYAFGLYNFTEMPDDLWENLKEKAGFTDKDIKLVKKKVSKKLNIREVTSRSYQAVKVLEEKGYSKEWILGYLGSNGSFLKDWLDIAEACPEKGGGEIDKKRLK